MASRTAGCACSPRSARCDLSSRVASPAVFPVGARFRRSTPANVRRGVPTLGACTPPASWICRRGCRGGLARSRTCSRRARNGCRWAWRRGMKGLREAWALPAGSACGGSDCGQCATCYVHCTVRMGLHAQISNACVLHTPVSILLEMIVAACSPAPTFLHQAVIASPLVLQRGDRPVVGFTGQRTGPGRVCTLRPSRRSTRAFIPARRRSSARPLDALLALCCVSLWGVLAVRSPPPPPLGPSRDGQPGAAGATSCRPQAGRPQRPSAAAEARSRRCSGAVAALPSRPPPGAVCGAGLLMMLVVMCSASELSALRT